MGENIGVIRQPLFGGDIVGTQTQEELGLVSLGRFCSGVLLRDNWVASAAHCVEVDGTTTPHPDPNRRGRTS